jgi:glycerol-3-phosphate dehydrogenase
MSTHKEILAMHPNVKNKKAFAKVLSTFAKCMKAHEKKVLWATRKHEVQQLVTNKAQDKFIKEQRKLDELNKVMTTPMEMQHHMEALVEHVSMDEVVPILAKLAQ